MKTHQINKCHMFQIAVTFLNSVLFTDQKRGGIFQMDLNQTDPESYSCLELFGHAKPSYLARFNSKMIVWTDTQRQWVGYGCIDGTCGG